MRAGYKNFGVLGPKYLRKAWIHKDGKHLDIETMSSNGNKLIKDLSIKEFRVYKNGKTPLDYNKLFNMTRNRQNIRTLGDVKFNDLLATPSYLFEANNVTGFVPYNAQTNKFVWENVLKNAKVDTNLV